MAKRNTDPISMSEALQGFVKENRLQKGMDKVDIAQAWYALNPAFKKYTEAIRLEDTTLFVRLKSSVFREELSYGKQKIINMLNEQVGRDIITKIILR